MTEQTGQEELLWVRACGGDARAFGELFDVHRDRVYRHAYWMVGDVHDAEDAAAVAFLELWRARARVRVVGGSVLPWLLVTVAHVVRNLRRGQRRYGGVLASLRPADAHPSAEQVAAERGSVYEHVDPRLAEVMRVLPRVDRGLLLLTTLEGYSMAEAAAALGLTEGAARTRLSRARAKLRGQLPSRPRSLAEGGTS